jgi:hypothetical protein
MIHFLRFPMDPFSPLIEGRSGLIKPRKKMNLSHLPCDPQKWVIEFLHISRSHDIYHSPQ